MKFKFFLKKLHPEFFSLPIFNFLAREMYSIMSSVKVDVVSELYNF